MNKLVERLRAIAAQEERDFHNFPDSLCSLETVKALREAAALIEALEKDAKRYRWLRSFPMRDGYALVAVEMLSCNEDGQTDTWYDYQGEELDAAIDNALNAEAGK